MKKYICLLASVGLLTACEQKETTVTNPPAENKTENNTTVVKEPAKSGSSTKTETETNVNKPDTSSSSSTTTTTSSPNP